MTSIESTKVVKREIEIEVKELSGCNLESLSFAELLYNGLIKLVVSKIDSGALGQPAPQIGPLMMEVKQLKNEFLNQTMNDDAIEKMRTALIRGARTLVKAGDVQPKDLSFLPCNLTDQEGYLIFPLSTLNEARSEDFNQWKLSPRLTHENDSVLDTTSVSTLLSVLHFGSSSPLANSITDMQIQKGEDIMTNLNQTIDYHLQIRSNNKTSSRIRIEKHRYMAKLRKIFKIPDTTDDESIEDIIGARVLTKLQKKALKLEKLSFQYRVIMEIVDILNINYHDLPRGVRITMPVDILFDLFPDFEAGAKSITSFSIVLCILRPTLQGPCFSDMDEMTWNYGNSTNDRNETRILIITLSKLLSYLQNQTASKHLSSNDVITLQIYLNKKRFELQDEAGQEPEKRDDLAIDTAREICKRLITDYNIQLVDIAEGSNNTNLLWDELASRQDNRNCNISSNHTHPSGQELIATCSQDEQTCLTQLLYLILDTAKAMNKVDNITDAQFETMVATIENSDSSETIQALATVVKDLGFDPEAIGIGSKQASKSKILRKVFNWYFKEQREERKRVRLLIDKLFKKTKTFLNPDELTEKQVNDIAALQSRVNADGKKVAKKFLGMNMTSLRGNEVSAQLDRMVQLGQLSDDIIDEVMEFALLQKVFIIMRLVQVLNLTVDQFDTELTAEIPAEFIEVMFGSSNDATIRRKRETLEADVSKPKLDLSDLISIAFYLYHRSITIATKKIEAIDQETSDLKEEIESVLNSQKDLLRQKLKPSAPLSTESWINSSFILIHANDFSMNLTNRSTFDRVILKLQLKVTKQIILLLDLKPQDFHLLGNFPLTHGLAEYLFGEVPESDHKVIDKIYAEVRETLSQRAHDNQLTPNQVIMAKEIIHSLNTETVASLVEIFELDEDQEHPDKTIEAIKDKLKSKDDEEKVEKALKVIRDNKIKAIKLLALLLDLQPDEVDAAKDISHEIKEHLFNGIALDKWSKLEGVNSKDSVFCMSCFHKAYELWKEQNEIDQREDSESETDNNESDIQGRMISDGSIAMTSQSGEEGEELTQNEALEFLEDTGDDLTLGSQSHPTQQETSSTESRSQDKYLGLILYLYQHIVQDLKDNDTEAFQQLLKHQKRTFFTKLSSVLDAHSEIGSNSSLVIVLDVRNLSDTTIDQLENLAIDFYIDMLRHLKSDWNASTHEFDEIDIPQELLEVLKSDPDHAETSLNKTETKLEQLRRYYAKVKSEYNSEALRGDISESILLQVSRTVVNFEERQGSRLRQVFGDKYQQQPLSTLQELYDSEKASGKLDTAKVHDYESEEANDLLNTTKTIMNFMGLEKQFFNESTSLLDDLGSKRGLEARSGVVDNDNDDDEYLNVLNTGQFEVPSHDGKIPFMDLDDPSNSSESSTFEPNDPSQFIIGKRSLSSSASTFTCESLRETGLSFIPLTRQWLEKLTLQDLVDCLDIIYSFEPVEEIWQEVMDSTTLTQLEILLMLEKAPALVIRTEEDNQPVLNYFKENVEFTTVKCSSLSNDTILEEDTAKTFLCARD